MIKERINTTRPLQWEDETPSEPRFRRVPQSVPPNGRALPGMPLEMADPDGDDPPRLKRPSNPWWRPASTVGRTFLALSVLIVLTASTAGFIALKAWLGRDARFRIAGTGNIEATGLTQVSRADMLPVFGEDIGRNIFFVPLDERRKELERIPWVQRATVMRLLPDQIRVALTERQPIAFVRQGQQIGLVDASGVLLSMPAAAMARHHYSFPVVTGIDPGDPLASRKARMAVYRRLMAELDSGNQRLSEQLSEIDLTDPEDARVLMPEPGADILAHFGDDRFLERFQRYKAHIAEWRQQYPKLQSVDLRYDQQVVLKMSDGRPLSADLDGSAAPALSDAKPSAAGSAEPSPVNLQAVSTNSSATKPPASKPAEKAKSASTSTASKHAKAKPLTAKEKIAKALAAQKKKHELAQRAALNLNRQNHAATAHAATAAAQGQ